MPIYEYTCHDCNRRVSLLWRSFSDAQTGQAACPRCGSTHLTRVVSKVAVLRSEGGRRAGSADGDDLAGPSGLGAGLAGGDVDENDPRSLAKFMRQMARETAAETGEDLGPEFEEVVGRLEAGEDPEEIEKSMPDLAGDSSMGDAPGGYPGGGDDFGVM